MTILTRYVIKAHIGPFLFAFIAVTGLLFLNAVAQRLSDLVGKGLGPEVFGEFMLLSLPHIVALTFPMAVLVAVLYTFSEMTAQNEITAMAAGGIRPTRLLAPMLVIGVGLTVMMFYFNAQVLPESNHRLSSLMSDVGSKSPTLELREQVINEVHTGDNTRYFLKARSIDQASNTMVDVTIYDMSRPGDNRVIVADHGEMAFTEDRMDLYVLLADGTVFETTEERPGGFQRMDFERQVIPFRGVGTELERRTAGGGRGARELTIPMLEERVAEGMANLRSLGEESRQISRRTVETALGLDHSDDGEETELLSPAVVEPGGMVQDGEIAETRSTLQITENRWNVHALSIYRFQVEIHKKYAIAFACLIFILLGGPFAARFPQGGVGMVIAMSAGIFFLYWVGLIGGERLAVRGHLNPVIAMWLPNLILFTPGLWMAWRMGRQGTSNRSGAFDGVRGWLRDPLNRRGAVESAPGPAVGGGR